MFSFAEPGFQEFQTMEYLTAILAKNGFKITKGVAGIPTAWTATWGEGGPLIALGSDVDGLLGVSQMPGHRRRSSRWSKARRAMAKVITPGMPLIVAAALATKEVMEKNGIKGRLMLWPGVAEELLATKAYYVRDGLFKDVDANIFTHVSSATSRPAGAIGGNNGMVSVEYTFHGKTAHAAGQPWDGRSALDAVEIMNMAWNMRREHLPLTQRSHYVITNGGGQPNIVPDVASVWYYFREHDLRVRARRSTRSATRYREGGGQGDRHHRRRTRCSAMPRRTMATSRWPRLPMPTSRRSACRKWTADDQAFAKAVQTANKRHGRAARDDGHADCRRPTTASASDSAADRTTSATSCGRCRRSPSASRRTSPA